MDSEDHDSTKPCGWWLSKLLKQLTTEVTADFNLSELESGRLVPLVAG